MVTLGSLSLGPVRRARWALVLLWRSLTTQQRRFFLTILLAGFAANFQRRGGCLQRVTRLFSGVQCSNQEDEELGHSGECSKGLQQPGTRSGQPERHEDSMKRGYLTRPVALGDKGRAHSTWSLRQQYLRGANCDVVFSVDGRSFPAHRCWVAAFSMPLRAMFSSGMRESQEDVIHLHDTDASTFGLFLDFIYDGAVELSVHNIESVLELSVRYGVGPLVEQCCDFLAGAIDTTNGFGILTLADKYHCQPLRRDALLYVVANFEGCWALDRDGFSRLAKPLVKDVLGHDALVPSEGEATVFMAAVAWLQEQMRSSNIDRDSELVNDVLSHVRFALIAPEVLAGEIENHALMQDEPCRQYVLEAYRLQALTHGDVQQLTPTSRSTTKTSTQAPAEEAARDTVSRALIKAMGERARPRVPLRLEAPPLTGSSSNNSVAHSSVLSPRASDAPRATAIDAWLSCVPEADEVGKEGEGASWLLGSPTRREEGRGQARPAAEVASVAPSLCHSETTSRGAASREMGPSGYDHLFFGRKEPAAPCDGRAVSSRVAAAPRTVSV